MRNTKIDTRTMTHYLLLFLFVLVAIIAAASGTGFIPVNGIVQAIRIGFRLPYWVRDNGPTIPGIVRCIMIHAQNKTSRYRQLSDETVHKNHKFLVEPRGKCLHQGIFLVYRVHDVRGDSVEMIRCPYSNVRVTSLAYTRLIIYYSLMCVFHLLPLLNFYSSVCMIRL